jgi:hypothetical protein
LGRRLLNRGRKQNLRTIRGLRRSLSSMPTRVSCVSPDESRSHEEFISLIGKVVEEANECKV